MQHTPMIGALLKRCGLPYVHLTVSSPDYTYVRATSEIVGIQHRNVGLKWIREHCGYGKCNSGVVYFGDDDDRYDLRLFDKVRFGASRKPTWLIVRCILIYTHLYNFSHCRLTSNLVGSSRMLHCIDVVTTCGI